MALQEQEDDFRNGLHDILSTEQKIHEDLQQLSEEGLSPALKASLEEHLAQSQGHIDRLNQVFNRLSD